MLLLRSYAESRLANNQKDEGPLLLLDGMSLIFRAFFALSTDISTSTGLVTNALHGFASMLHSLIKTQHPRGIVVAFDLPGGTFRDQMTDDYKGGRAETPDALPHQFGLVRDFCAALNIPVIGIQNYEADDVLATMARWGRERLINTVVVTGDRDSFQLVQDPYVRVLYNRRGVSDYALYDEAGIFERCGIEPGRYPLLAALRGDPSDNLPGVPGIGEKTAAKLLATFADFDQLFANVDSLTPKLRENLISFEARARNNVAVMTLVDDVPFDVSLEDVHLGGWDASVVEAFFDFYEMNGMKRRFQQLIKEGLIGNSSIVGKTEQVSPTKSVDEIVVLRPKELNHFSTVADTTIFFTNSRVAALQIVEGLSWVGEREEFLEWALKSSPRIIGCDLKRIYRQACETGRPLVDPIGDISLMSFIIDPTSGRYTFPDIAVDVLSEVVKERPNELFETSSPDEDLIAGAVVVGRVHGILEGAITSLDLDFIYREIELPLLKVLASMEARGIFVDRKMLTEIAEGFATEVSQLDNEIQVLVGHEFKVNSPQQLQKVLFEELGLSPGKKIKTGYSTDAATLEGLRGQHPVIELILRFREIDKLRSTYGTSLLATIGTDERIHATFQQTVARTGRLSSDSPNLHNIPVRTSEGRRLRFAFGPQPGWSLLVADYDQIELRIIAHLSQDPGLLAAFAADQDVHRSIASVVFGVAPNLVSHDQRETAKAVSYGLAYGMEAFGLSQRLGISVGESKSIIDKYFGGFPSLKNYMDSSVDVIRKEGFSRTEFGRIRPFPDLLTAVGPQRQAAERQAMNAGIQGLAADIFKLALVRVDKALTAADLEARLVLQVHDEIIVESPPEEMLRVEQIVLRSMTEAAHLSVPLEVSMHWGSNWAEAKA
ncbi:MAG: DNA polymerase I [Actinomycetota bacterium]